MTHLLCGMSSPLIASAMPTTIHYSFTWLDFAAILIPLLLAFVVSQYMRTFTRGVADYLVANRTAGRYVISTAQLSMGVTAIGTVSALEVFSQTGFSLGVWQSFIGFLYFLLAISGAITYRFGENRALTFHRFLEMRFSKEVRVFATFLNVFSGLFTFGVGPAVADSDFLFPAAIATG
jgi:solute:Na+ symporter, SSS family